MSKSILELGDKFSSYDEFLSKLEEHKNATFTEYWIRATRSLESAAARAPERVRDCNKNLKYYYCKLSCIYGGDKYRPKRGATPGKQVLSKKGASPGKQVFSFRQGCEAGISLSLSADGQSLFIKDIKNNHNHPNGPQFKKSFEHVPQQRKQIEASQGQELPNVKRKANKELIHKDVAITNDMSKPILELGDKFSSYDEFLSKLEEHKTATLTEYWVRDTRSLDAAATRVPDRVRGCNKNLKYYYCKLSCIYGGDKYRPKKVATPGKQVFSFRQGCEASISLFLSADGQSLFIKHMINNHNHPVGTQKSFDHQLLQTRDNDTSGQELQNLKEELVLSEVTGTRDEILLQKDLANIVEITGKEDTSKHILKLGDEFASYNEFLDKFEEHKNATFTEYWLRDSRTLEAAARRIPDRVRYCNKNLKYYYCKWSCIHGGDIYRPKKRAAAGKQAFPKKGAACGKQIFSFRQGCEAAISLSLSADGQSLFIKDMKNHHNHPISLQKSFGYLPQQRKKRKNPSGPKGLELQNVKANNKMFQSKVALTNSKKMSQKDLEKIVKTSGREEEENNFVTCIKTLTEKHCCQVDLFINEPNDIKFRGMFVQDQSMRESYQSFPETLFVVCTKELLQIHKTVYFFLVEDSSGNSEIVSIGILMLEDVESLSWLTAKFKQHNPIWEETSVIMSDRSTVKQTVFQQHFPLAKLLICKFHTLEIFEQEVICALLGKDLTNSEEKLTKEYLEMAINCTSLVQYNQVYEEMTVTLPCQVMAYYNEHWHVIKEHWVLGLTHKTGNFYNATNNRTESLFNRLKSSIPNFSSLKDFFKFLFIELKIYKSELDCKVQNIVYKVPIHEYSEGSPIVRYLDLLTCYSFKYVEHQFTLVCRVRENFEENEDGDIIVNTPAGKLIVSEQNCECSFNMSMGLPCSHILFVRQYKGLDLFDDSLCLKRWTKAYYISNHRAFRQHFRAVYDSSEARSVPVYNLSYSAEAMRTSVTADSQFNQPLSVAEKFQRLMKTAKKMVTFGAEARNSVYEHRYETLDKIISCWENGENVSVSKSVDNEVNQDYYPFEKQASDDSSPTVVCYEVDDDVFIKQAIDDSSPTVVCYRVDNVLTDQIDYCQLVKNEEQ